jgi:hypothetical protein
MKSIPIIKSVKRYLVTTMIAVLPMAAYVEGGDADQVSILSHIKLGTGGQTEMVRFSRSQNEYLTVNDLSTRKSVVIDVTSLTHPQITQQANYGSAKVEEHAGSIALVSNKPANSTDVVPMHLKLVDMSDPRRPAIAREFVDVRGFIGDHERNVFYILDRDTLWVVKITTSTEVEAQKARDLLFESALNAR